MLSSSGPNSGSATKRASTSALKVSATLAMSGRAVVDARQQHAPEKPIRAAINPDLRSLADSVHDPVDDDLGPFLQRRHVGILVFDFIVRRLHPGDWVH